MADSDSGECRCSNIYIMQLFHQLKQRFPTVPDHIVSKVIGENHHDKGACETILQNEIHVMQCYPGALISGEVKPGAPGPLADHCSAGLKRLSTDNSTDSATDVTPRHPLTPTSPSTFPKVSLPHSPVVFPRFTDANDDDDYDDSPVISSTSPVNLDSTKKLSEPSIPSKRIEHPNSNKDEQPAVASKQSAAPEVSRRTSQKRVLRRSTPISTDPSVDEDLSSSVSSGPDLLQNVSLSDKTDIDPRPFDGSECCSDAPPPVNDDNCDLSFSSTTPRSSNSSLRRKLFVRSDAITLDSPGTEEEAESLSESAEPPLSENVGPYKDDSIEDVYSSDTSNPPAQDIVSKECLSQNSELSVNSTKVEANSASKKTHKVHKPNRLELSKVPLLQLVQEVQERQKALKNNVSPQLIESIQNSQAFNALSSPGNIVQSESSLPQFVQTLDNESVISVPAASNSPLCQRRDNCQNTSLPKPHTPSPNRLSPRDGYSNQYSPVDTPKQCSPFVNKVGRARNEPPKRPTTLEVPLSAYNPPPEYEIGVECVVQPSPSGNSQRPFTSVNLTLRPPSSEAPLPIEISSGQGLTYRTAKFDPKQGYQSQLQIRIGPAGGCVTACRVGIPSVSSRGTSRSPCRAGAFCHSRPHVRALLQQQRERKDLLARELRLEREKLRFMQKQAASMAAMALAKKPSPFVLSRLKADVVRLRGQCERLTAAVDRYAEERNVPLGETDGDFYHNIYTGQRQQRGGWSCHVCTFRNHQLMRVCEQCEMPRQSLGTSSSLGLVNYPLLSNSNSSHFAVVGETSTSVSRTIAPLQER